jgi:hypothetical protein
MIIKVVCFGIERIAIGPDKVASAASYGGLSTIQEIVMFLIKGGGE